MACRRAPETHQAEKYQLRDKKETTGQAVVWTANPKVGLFQTKWHVPVWPRPRVVPLLFPGLDGDTGQVGTTLSGRNHFGANHYTTRGNKA